MIRTRFAAALAAVSLFGASALRTVVALVVLLPGTSWADNAAQTLPFAQNWSNAALITVDDDWTGVPGIEGFRGDNLTAATGCASTRRHVQLGAASRYRACS